METTVRTPRCVCTGSWELCVGLRLKCNKCGAEISADELTAMLLAPEEDPNKLSLLDFVQRFDRPDLQALADKRALELD